MAVTLNAPPQHGFDQPLGLLSDCHRRIERFLEAIRRVCVEARGDALDGPHLEALESALRYFENAAPWHTQDEESSLFPRLRRLQDERVQAVLENVDRLETEHSDAKARHREVHKLGKRWITQGTLTTPELTRLETLIEALRATYERHIAYEDTVLFPLAAAVLPPPSITAIGREMAERRGVDPGLPPRRCKHRRAARDAPGR